MKISHALRSARPLRSDLTRPPTMSMRRLMVAASMSHSPRPPYQLYRVRQEFYSSRRFGRQYSTARPSLSTDDGSYKSLKTDFYGDAGFGRVRCDEMALGKDGHRIARVTIQNSNVGNSLNPSLLQNLTMVFRELGAKDHLRCVILTGERLFCTGMVS